MKKTLFTCVAVSALYTTAALAQTPAVAEQTPAAPAQTPAVQSTETPASAVVQTAPAAKADTIAEAIAISLFYNGLKTDKEPTVTAQGNDFILSIPEIKITDAAGKTHTFPATQINMTRVSDFGNHAQYKMDNITLPYLKTIFAGIYENGKITEDSFAETVYWVPDLALRTKQSLKTANLNIDTGLGTTFKIAALHLDNLTGVQEPDKMDSAGSLDVQDIALENALFTLSIPKLTADTQVLGANQTPDMLLQTLSASLSKSTVSIPEIKLIPTTPLFAPLSVRGDVVSETIRDEKTNDMQMRLTMSMAQLNLEKAAFENGILPAAFPEEMRLDAVLAGLNGAQIQSILQMQEKLDEEPDEQTPENIALQNEIQKQLMDVLNNVRLNINELALENPVAGMRFTGTGRFIDQTPRLNGQLAITNFDLISPDYQAQCAAEKAKQPQSEKQSVQTTEPAVCAKIGVFDVLRPYLKSAEQTTQNNKPVTIFHIEYKDGQTFINNELFTPILPTDLLDEKAAQK